MGKFFLYGLNKGGGHFLNIVGEGLEVLAGAGYCPFCILCQMCWNLHHNYNNLNLADNLKMTFQLSFINTQSLFICGIYIFID